MRLDKHGKYPNQRDADNKLKQRLQCLILFLFFLLADVSGLYHRLITVYIW